MATHASIATPANQYILFHAQVGDRVNPANLFRQCIIHRLYVYYQTTGMDDMEEFLTGLTPAHFEMDLSCNFCLFQDNVQLDNIEQHLIKNKHKEFMKSLNGVLITDPTDYMDRLAQFQSQ